MRAIRRAFGAAAISLLLLAAPAPPSAAQVDESGLPGAGQPVRLARPTWDSGWFQAEVVAQLLERLDYAVDGPLTLDNADFYRQVGDGSIDLWANGWFPLHQGLLDANPGASPVGFHVRGGALQGYMADRATVERLGIETLADLADPEVAAAFDTSGDGVADLIGCNAGWSCGPIVEHHLDRYGLRDRVNQIRGDYGPLMQSATDRYRSGQPILFYSFTPNWTLGQLVPGRDVVWIPTPFPSLPTEIAEEEPLTVVPTVAGCSTDPCTLGFPPNDIRAVANDRFLADNPAVATLLDAIRIPLDDIAAQNALMIDGQDSAGDLERHATDWIERNRQLVDGWIGAAIDAHVAAGLPLAPATRPATGPSPTGVGTLRVVTRLAPPFVTYDGTTYGGFTIDLLEMVADDLGADLQLYAVNSSVKLIDDVERGEADLGAGAVAITADRETLIDFSQPYFETGLQILVAESDDGLLGGRLGAVVRTIFSLEVLFLLLALIAVLVVAAHVIWLTERRSNPEFPASYGAGVWESLWWAAVTATTVGYGDKTPKGWPGRLFGLFWMFSGLFVLAYFTAGIATAFTIDELRGAIDGPSDLRGQTVGAPADSLASEFLRRQGIAATAYPTAAEAYDALLDGRVDAVVHDAPIVQHFAATDPRGGVQVTGLVFAERGLGFVAAPDADLVEAVNRSLLGLVESGDYDELTEEWFGTVPAGN